MGVDSTLVGVPNFDKFEIIKVGNTSLNYSATEMGAGTSRSSILGETTVTHNLGYVPVVFVFKTDNVESFNTPISDGTLDYPVFTSTTYANFLFQINVTSVDLVIQYAQVAYTSAAGFGPYSGTFLFKYYLLRTLAK